MSVHVTSPVWLAEFPRPAMKTVALKLADCANDEGENIYPSAARVSRETGASESTVREVLAAFEEAGLLIVVQEATGNRFGRSTTIRRFDLLKLKQLAAVDNKDGTFVPPTHCLTQVETGETRTTKAGVEVPVFKWIIRPRTSADKSAYDTLTPPVSGGAEPPAPPESGGVPLRSPDPTPPVSGGCPSGERTLTVNEPSGELPPNPPVGGEGGGVSCETQRFAKGWSADARNEILDMADNPVVAHVANALGGLAGTLGPPREADPVAYVRQWRNQLRPFDAADLLTAAGELTVTRNRDLPGIADVVAAVKRAKAQREREAAIAAHKLPVPHELAQCGPTKSRSPAPKYEITPASHPEAWEAWLATIEAREGGEARAVAAAAGKIRVSGLIPLRGHVCEVVPHSASRCGDSPAKTAEPLASTAAGSLHGASHPLASCGAQKREARS